MPGPDDDVGDRNKSFSRRGEADVFSVPTADEAPPFSERNAVVAALLEEGLLPDRSNSTGDVGVRSLVLVDLFISTAEKSATLL